MGTIILGMLSGAFIAFIIGCIQRSNLATKNAEKYKLKNVETDSVLQPFKVILFEEEQPIAAFMLKKDAEDFRNGKE